MDRNVLLRIVFSERERKIKREREIKKERDYNKV